MFPQSIQHDAFSIWRYKGLWQAISIFDLDSGNQKSFQDVVNEFELPNHIFFWYLQYIDYVKSCCSDKDKRFQLSLIDRLIEKWSYSGAQCDLERISIQTTFFSFCSFPLGQRHSSVIFLSDCAHQLPTFGTTWLASYMRLQTILSLQIHFCYYLAAAHQILTLPLVNPGDFHNTCNWLIFVYW